MKNNISAKTRELLYKLRHLELNDVYLQQAHAHIVMLRKNNATNEANWFASKVELYEGDYHAFKKLNYNPIPKR